MSTVPIRSGTTKNDGGVFSFPGATEQDPLKGQPLKAAIGDIGSRIVSGVDVTYAGNGEIVGGLYDGAFDGPYTNPKRAVHSNIRINDNQTGGDGDGINYLAGAIVPRNKQWNTHLTELTNKGYSTDNVSVYTFPGISTLSTLALRYSVLSNGSGLFRDTAFTQPIAVDTVISGIAHYYNTANRRMIAYPRASNLNYTSDSAYTINGLPTIANNSAGSPAGLTEYNALLPNITMGASGEMYLVFRKRGSSSPTSTIFAVSSQTSAHFFELRVQSNTLWVLMQDGTTPKLDTGLSSYPFAADTNYLAQIIVPGSGKGQYEINLYSGGYPTPTALTLTGQNTGSWMNSMNTANTRTFGYLLQNNTSGNYLTSAIMIGDLQIYSQHNRHEERQGIINELLTAFGMD